MQPIMWPRTDNLTWVIGVGAGMMGGGPDPMMMMAMQDPELGAAMQDPQTMQVLMSIMESPDPDAELAKYADQPQVEQLLRKRKTSPIRTPLHPKACLSRILKTCTCTHMHTHTVLFTIRSRNFRLSIGV